MSQFTEKIKLEYGWLQGEHGWGEGVNENFVKIDKAFALLDEALQEFGQTLSDRAMTELEKEKLAGIEANANNYQHPLSHLAKIISFDDGESLQQKYNRGALSGNTEEARALSQIEIEVMNIALYLEALRYYPDYNALTPETFTTMDSIDQYNCKVTGILAGNNSINVNDITNIIPGAWYTVSDGANQELIQVKACSKNNGFCTILATENIVNTYNINNAMIYRTTAQIHSGVVYGSGDKKGFNWRPNQVWQGIVANQETAAPLETTQDKADEFVCQDNLVFTADGLVSLEVK